MIECDASSGQMLAAVIAKASLLESSAAQAADRIARSSVIATFHPPYL